LVLVLLNFFRHQYHLVLKEIEEKKKEFIKKKADLEREKAESTTAQGPQMLQRRMEARALVGLSHIGMVLIQSRHQTQNHCHLFARPRWTGPVGLVRI
jgi:hypothetical protein